MIYKNMKRLSIILIFCAIIFNNITAENIIHSFANDTVLRKSLFQLYFNLIDNIENDINYFDSIGRKDGIWIENRHNFLYATNYVNGKIDGFEIAISLEDSIPEITYLGFYNHGWMIAAISYESYDEDDVFLFDNFRRFETYENPKIQKLIEDKKNNGAIPYGYVIYNYKKYNNGILREEGECVCKLEEDGYVDLFEFFYFIGEWKFYNKDGELEKTVNYDNYFYNMQRPQQTHPNEDSDEDD